MDTFCPKLRSVDVFPAEVSGQKVFCLRDPLNLSEKILFFPYGAFFIISLLDGNHSVLDIQAEFMRRFGQFLYRERIQELIDQLAENFLLDDERFHKAEEEMIATFKRSSTRPMILGEEEGGGEGLKERIHAYFSEPEGPGIPAVQGSRDGLVAAIAPHIDYRRGGACYAFTHRAILESSPADLFLILGTAHSPMETPFALTQKDFQTPWGPVETDRSFLKEFDTGLPYNLYEDEFVHKGEHSIELQVTFLAALRPPGSFQIVPILCGSLQKAILENISPLELPGVRPFIEKLRATLARSSRKVCLLASADLAHVGLRFGDPEPPDRLSLQSLARKDQDLLAWVERMDAENFYDSLRRERDCRRICGFPPIYTLLHLLAAREGKLLKYAQSVDPTTQSVVSFASLVFFS